MCHKSVSAQAELRKIRDRIREENEGKPVEQECLLCTRLAWP